MLALKKLYHKKNLFYLQDPEVSTETWCSTKIDSRGEHIEGINAYGFCSSACPKHEENKFLVKGMICWIPNRPKMQTKKIPLFDYSTGSALSFGRTWPGKNSQIPDVVCTLVRNIFGWNIHMIVVYFDKTIFQQNLPPL